MSSAEAPSASEDGRAPLPFLRRADGLEQRMVVLMGARLALALVSLGIALALDTTVGGLDDAARLGLYGTVAFAFLATAAYGLALPRIRNPQGFAAVNIATDIVIVTCLVRFSGGADSIFSFLYVLVAIYGALLFDRRGALLTACLGVLAYGGVLLLERVGLPGTAVQAVLRPPAVAFAVWAIHAGAIVLVAALASFLSAELRRTGEALRQRTGALRRLADLHGRTVESLRSGLLTTDGEGRVTSFNPEAERITGRATRDVMGREVEEVLPGIRAAVVDGADGGTRSEGRARISYRSLRGEDLHLGVAAYHLLDAERTACGHIVIFQDVTAVVAMEAELRRSERLAAVGELSASIAHEIRNPLAAISGSIQILRKQAASLEGAAESRRLMDIVLRETDRLNLLITDFLEYARPAPPKLEAVPVDEAVAELREVLEPALADGVELVVEVPGGLVVWADPGQLRQVLWNLALNGCQAMPRGGTLDLSARALAETLPQEARSAGRNGVKRAWVEITLCDQGEGIPAEVADHIFDPFFTTKPEGSGLGLATVHRIVEEHGGSIQLESAPGRGTRVTLRLPRAEDAS